MPESDPLASSPPAGGAADSGSRAVRAARRVVGILAYALLGLEARFDLRFRRKEPLPPFASELSLPPLFVGGTGRSGTTITARILGAHPAYHMIPFEVLLVSVRGGLCDLVEGNTDFHTFAWKVRHRWSLSAPRTGGRALVSEARQRAALVELRDGLGTDRDRAAVRFVHRLLDPVALAAGASGWIEMRPTNVHVAPVLARLWPASKLVHAVRDGRDVACSVTPLRWGPGAHADALRWWARTLDRAFAACARAPAGYVHTLQMEALLGTDRDVELARLLAFVGLDEAPEVRAFFDRLATPKRANLARWRRDVAPDQVAAFLALHDALAARLGARGYPYVPFEEPATLPVAAEG